MAANGAEPERLQGEEAGTLMSFGIYCFRIDLLALGGKSVDVNVGAHFLFGVGVNFGLSRTS
jgi:hypothetical protein